jgi:hypothetical protein
MIDLFLVFEHFCLFTANASKTCMPDGGWYIHPEFNTTWTNLSGCYDPTRTSGTSILLPAIIQVIYHIIGIVIFIFGVLTPLSAIFQLFHGEQF